MTNFPHILSNQYSSFSGGGVLLTKAVVGACGGGCGAGGQAAVLV